MIKEGKIGVQEAIFLISITICVRVYFTSPAYVAKATGTASWYMTLISAFMAIIGFTFVYILLKRFPGKDLIGAFELSLGRIAGFVFSIVIGVYLFINAAIVLREFVEMMKVYVLPLTPPSFIVGTLLIMTVGACFLGLESIARFSKLTGYFLLAGFLSVCLLAWNNYDFRNLFPLFGYGLDKTIIYGLSRSSFYGEVIILAIISTSLQGLSHIKKAGYISLVISGIITSISLFTTMLAFNYATSQEITSRVFELTKVIRVGDFLQRLDPIFVFTWSIGSTIAVTVYFYTGISTYCKSFRIQDMRPVIIPAAILLFAVTMIPQDLVSVADIVHLTRQYGWSIFFGLPLIALIVAVIRKKKGEQKSA